MLVIGRTPELCADPKFATAQRALEGLTRAIGKEFKKGMTSQVVYVAPGAENQIESTARFFLSAKSAYVSAQVVRVSPSDARVSSTEGTMESSTRADDNTPGMPAPGCVPAPTR